jgi:hypothetical protein
MNKKKVLIVFMIVLIALFFAGYAIASFVASENTGVNNSGADQDQRVASAKEVLLVPLPPESVIMIEPKNPSQDPVVIGNAPAGAKPMPAIPVDRVELITVNMDLKGFPGFTGKKYVYTASDLVALEISQEGYDALLKHLSINSAYPESIQFRFTEQTAESIGFTSDLHGKTITLSVMQRK